MKEIASPERNEVHFAERDEHKSALQAMTEVERGYYEDNDMR